MVSWRHVEISAIPSASCHINYVMAPSWWDAFEGHCHSFVATPLVFSYYSHSSSRIMPGAAYLAHCHVRVLHLLVTGFLCMACDGPCFAAGGSSLHRIWASGMLISLLSGVRETLEMKGIMAVLCNSGFEMALGYMAHYRSSDIDWPRCMSSWFH